MSEAIPPFPQYALMAWCSVKPQGQLYLYLYGMEIDHKHKNSVRIVLLQMLYGVK